MILGWKQNYGIVYLEKFSPVAKMSTMRAMLVVATMKNWFVHLLDVLNAFSNGEMEETVYMTIHKVIMDRGVEYLWVGLMLTNISTS